MHAARLTPELAMLWVLVGCFTLVNVLLLGVGVRVTIGRLRRKP